MIVCLLGLLYLAIGAVVSGVAYENHTRTRWESSSDAIATRWGWMLFWPFVLGGISVCYVYDAVINSKDTDGGWVLVGMAFIDPGRLGGILFKKFMSRREGNA